MNFGEKLKQIRIENKLNQVEMAEILYTTQGNYSQYESNARIPSMDLLKRIIERFNLDANWLILDTLEQSTNFTGNISTAGLNDINLAEKLSDIDRKFEIIISKLQLR